jgi:bifunctional non-homologous end joining protein LigD
MRTIARKMMTRARKTSRRVPSPDRLSGYRSKRDFDVTPEPSGHRRCSGGGQAAQRGRRAAPRKSAPASRFVVQQHHARRLHWDLRLEHGGTLASWALPNGIPLHPGENRLAVRTEEHPLEYLEFEGEIPRGHYGAGTVKIWDRGTFAQHKWGPDKVEVTLRGERVRGRYGLFASGRGGGGESSWMIHRIDPPEDPAWVPMPEHVVPMLATPSTRPPGDEWAWSFEVKWDGVRAVAYAKPGRLRLESRNLNDITAAYPEVRGLLDDLGMREAVLDGEIIAFEESDPGHPRPSFERLQRRMHVNSDAAARRLMASVPVTYVIFDLLYLDGRLLIDLPYRERRERLEALGLNGSAWRVPAAHRGSDLSAAALLEATRERGLEGIIAKRLRSPYEPGRRAKTWLKIKHTLRQELVIGGWLPGEGGRARRIGALLVGYYERDGASAASTGQARDRAGGGAGGEPPASLRYAGRAGAGAGGEPPASLRYAGRVGSGFTDAALEELRARLKPLRRETSPFTAAPRLPRGAVFVEPCLVAEVEFREWTADGVMRAPSYKGLREDKAPHEVVLERRGTSGLAADRERARRRRPPTRRGAPARVAAAGLQAAPPTPEALFDEVKRLPDGSLEVLADGRRLKLTNWEKVLYPQTGFTKGDLVAYYARVAPYALPHLRDRPLTLKRCPDGVEAGHFYEKNAPPHRPNWVQTARVGEIEYTLAQDRPTLIWLANLAAIELHASLSLHTAADAPTMLVFDLDPGPPADIVDCCQVAVVLEGLFRRLGLESFVKTSGSKGLQVYVPLDPMRASYPQTKAFAKRIAGLLEQRMPELVVSRMTRRLRPGRVLVDWSQNDQHKTTVAVYSVRARPEPTVSTPVTWDEVRACLSKRAAARLTFDADAVLARVVQRGDLFAPVISLRQLLPPAT